MMLNNLEADLGERGVVINLCAVIIAAIYVLCLWSSSGRGQMVLIVKFSLLYNS